MNRLAPYAFALLVLFTVVVLLIQNRGQEPEAIVSPESTFSETSDIPMFPIIEIQEDMSEEDMTTLPGDLNSETQTTSFEEESTQTQ